MDQGLQQSHTPSQAEIPEWPQEVSAHISFSRTWRFITFAHAASPDGASPSGAPTDHPKCLIYVTATPECLHSLYAELWPQLLAARACHRHARTPQALADLNLHPQWAGKAVAIYAVSEDAAQVLATELDQILAAGHRFTGPAPTVRTQLVGPASGLVFLRRLAPSGNQQNSVRRHKLSELLG